MQMYPQSHGLISADDTHACPVPWAVELIEIPDTRSEINSYFIQNPMLVNHDQTNDYTEHAASDVKSMTGVSAGVSSCCDRQDSVLFNTQVSLLWTFTPSFFG